MTRSRRPIFAKAFFDLQLAFARRVRALSGMPLERALLDYTNLYVRFGLGRDFEAANDGWRSYLAGLRRAADAREWTYRFYLRDPEATTAPPLVASFGCFSYAVSEDGRARLHFRNTEPSGRSPLAAARIDQRRAELRALFEHLSHRMSLETRVVGVSWLYNLDAYRRLFPAECGKSARPIPGGFRSMALWGQLLDHRGEVKGAMGRPFLASLQKRTALDELGDCLPFRVLTVCAPAKRFHEFYASRKERDAAGPSARRQPRSSLSP